MAVFNQGGYGGLSLAFAVASVVGDEEVEADVAVKGGYAVVFGGDFAVAVEEEDCGVFLVVGEEAAA